MDTSEGDIWIEITLRILPRSDLQHRPWLDDVRLPAGVWLERTNWLTQAGIIAVGRDTTWKERGRLPESAGPFPATWVVV